MKAINPITRKLDMFPLKLKSLGLELLIRKGKNLDYKLKFKIYYFCSPNF